MILRNCCKYHPLLLRPFKTLVWFIDIERKYRLLNVCYNPTTSTTFLAFFLLFFAAASATNSSDSWQAVRAINQYVFLRCLYGLYSQF